MKSRCHPLALMFAVFLLGLAVACSGAKNELSEKGGDPAAAKKRPDVDPPGWFVMGSEPDAPRRYSAKAPPLSGPSVAAGQPPGIEVGQYAPDFELEPVEIYPELKELLGDKSPKSFADKVHFSDLMGRKPVMLIFGSYT